MRACVEIIILASIPVTLTLTKFTNFSSSSPRSRCIPKDVGLATPHDSRNWFFAEEALVLDQWKNSGFSSTLSSLIVGIALFSASSVVKEVAQLISTDGRFVSLSSKFFSGHVPLTRLIG